MLGLRFCARAFSSCGRRGPLFISVHGPLTIAASLIAEHRLQMRRLSSCGSRAQLLRGMWDLPRPGLEPVSPSLAGRFSTSAPPGKPYKFVLEYGLSTLRFPSISFWPLFVSLLYAVKCNSLWVTPWRHSHRCLLLWCLHFGRLGKMECINIPCTFMESGREL